MRYLSSFYWQQEEPALTSLALQQLVYRRRREPGIFACICTDRGMGQNGKILLGMRQKERMFSGAEQNRERTSEGTQDLREYIHAAVTGNAYLSQRLTYWFQTEGRDLFRRDRSGESVETRERLKRVIAQADGDWERYLVKADPNKEGKKAGKVCRKPDLIGLLGAGERFLLFSRGKQRAYLLNRRFERVHCSLLVGEDPEQDDDMGQQAAEWRREAEQDRWEYAMEREAEMDSRQMTGAEHAQEGRLQLLGGGMEPGIALLLATEEFAGKLSVSQMEQCLSVKELEKTENVRGRLRELGEEAARNGGHHLGAVLLMTRRGKEDGI